MLSPLNEISGFSSLVEQYNKNRDKDWREWLVFDKSFEKPGKQGLVGLLTTKDDKHQYVFKISQYINYLVHHEYTVMKGLNEISPYCPHFCKTVGTFLCQVDPNSRKSGNPFEISTKYPIEKECLLMEHIDKSCKFYNYIRSKKVSDDVIFSTIKQVLMAINIAQNKKKFTHYDLHSYNVMMRKCNKDVVFLYVLDDDNQFCVPTHGHYPVVIDFGFSYISDMDDQPLWASLAHTDVGFMSDRYDWLSDPKLFLVTVSYEMMQKRKNKKSRRLRNIVKNLFGRLNIEWDSGWDTGEEKGAADYVTELLEDYNTKSNLFDNYDHYCIDLIQSLIVLPLEEQKFSNIDVTYTTFLNEFVKIEEEIGNPFYNLYILKGIIDAARDVRPDYMDSKNRHHAVDYFRKAVHERISCVSKFCNPKNIHFEKMLCGLLCLSRNVEGVLHDVVYTRMQEKKKSYEKVPLKSTQEIYGAIEVNFPDEYVFNSNTTVFVMNCKTEACEMLELSEENIQQVNELHPMVRGSFLYDLHR